MQDVAGTSTVPIPVVNKQTKKKSAKAPASARRKTSTAKKKASSSSSTASRKAAKKAPAKKAAAKKAASKPAAKKPAATKKAATKKAAPAKSPARKTARSAGEARKKSLAAKQENAARPDDMNRDVLEFITAIDDYKRQNERPFPNWSEVWSVLRELGYERVGR